MIPTERAALRYRSVETWPTRDIVDAMLEAQIAAVSAALGTAEAMTGAVDAAARRLEAGGRLIYLGAGTSGRLGAIDAAELPPTFDWPAVRALNLMAGGQGAFVTAVEGAEDNGAAAIAALQESQLGAQDVVIGLAASGRTPYVVDGLRHAREVGALTVAVGNAPNGAIGAVAEYYLVADTGPEIVAGSTRMKAGTAQKAILTCFSTAIFVRMGYVYRGRMVEMRPTNEKLQGRAVAMVAELADVSLEEADAALAQASGSIKTAVVMLIRKLTTAEAKACLERANGRLHLVLQEAPGP
ncbi:N-acetylmuramic acid 6-phosphate etherase [Ponticoccus sp. SC2-23]|uniref:N-acetylmuramic acid 6-phosphate etherase n=1 Tax=Alexandriicola marinus TaxID=2081710 RepID=UPI000FD7E8EC|nr:N-acetylmuramic acid 6-phosphate etherase [Alexandriicola marinus]MBM1218602.1 N-acetylmuramic acid 6-phosphate etherase [Ponticoccus sp. SC6-9]MBM1224326.1 N-acetylmuramic acid 6-phosphate etherase [Ponticoccus sp. SC6-15]MBM1229895.1 N-acetylmuramic acid 6-phosphate etherase [Ponticoccus sp. SC6-38]MBM1233292.1 N-acetylmuramic acid 6-phosphate etherase [Ponticoccus sp. SC6-45]MBM1236758.1 N-acetylmuramic acid 6-phosphate etherase [Ponticoccus sp. SC6-49]MBM1242303.1 N-acetylmuramic acid 